MPKSTRSDHLPFALLVLLALLIGTYAMLGSHSWQSSVAVCGDGHVDIGEQCDDWNIHGDDGCDAVCHVEKGWACRLSPSACHQTICGDDLVDPGEQCDDGNRTDNDGCDELCKLETGWVCLGEPSTCHPVMCGDGFVDSGEQCDDHNVQNGDGCSVLCKTEPGWVCAGQPSTCKRATESLGLLMPQLSKSSRASAGRGPTMGAQGRPTVAGETLNLLKPLPLSRSSISRMSLRSVSRSSYSKRSSSSSNSPL